jgi:hypothetical protein
MVYITRISETELKIEADKGPVGHSYELERFISKLKTRGCTVRRTGYNGLAYVTGSFKLIAQWNKAGIQLNIRTHGDC